MNLLYICDWFNWNWKRYKVLMNQDEHWTLVQKMSSDPWFSIRKMQGEPGPTRMDPGEPWWMGSGQPPKILLPCDLSFFEVILISGNVLYDNLCFMIPLSSLLHTAINYFWQYKSYINYIQMIHKKVIEICTWINLI